jgi:hypothetical protein
MSPELEKIISRLRKNLKLDEIKESNIENKEATIENPVSRIEKMQNEPNYESTASPPTSPNGPRVMSDESRLNMQNKPNFESTASPPTSPNGSRATGHESRLMQNEPNLHDQMNVSPAITKDYENERPCELPQKTINQPRPKAETTNNQSSIINNQLKGVIAKRNQGRSEAYNHPRRPLRARLNKK